MSQVTASLENLGALLAKESIAAGHSAPTRSWFAPAASKSVGTCPFLDAP